MLQPWSSSSPSGDSQPEIPALRRQVSFVTRNSDLKPSHSTRLHSMLLPPSALYNSTDLRCGNHVKVTAVSIPRPPIDIPGDTQGHGRPVTPIMAYYEDSSNADMDVDSDDEFSDDSDDDESNGSGSLPLCSFILRTVHQERQEMPALVQVAAPPNQEWLESTPSLLAGQAMEDAEAAIPTPPVSSASPVPMPPSSFVGLLPTADPPLPNTFTAPTAYAANPTAPVSPAIPHTTSFPSTSTALYMPIIQPISHPYSHAHVPSAAAAYTSIYHVPSSTPAAAAAGGNYIPATFSPPRPPASASAQPASLSPDSPPFVDNPFTHPVSVPSEPARDRSATVVRRWTELEYVTLERAMVTFGRNWKLIIRMHGEYGIVDQYLARFTPTHLATKSSYEVCRKRQVLKMSDEQIGIMATAFKGRQMSARQEDETIARYVQEIAEERRLAMERLEAEENEAERQGLANGVNASAAGALGSAVGSQILP